MISSLRNRFQFRTFQSLLGLLIIFVVSTLLSPYRDGRNVFLEPQNLLNILRFASENGIIAIGMTFVILTGGIDLSVGAILALCSVGMAACLTRYGLGTAFTTLLILSLGGVVGFLNGWITTRFKIQSFITTLAMLSVLRGVASLWAGGYAIPIAYGSGKGLAPPFIKTLFNGEPTLLSQAVPMPLFYFLGIGLIGSLILRRSVLGRNIYATGGNDAAARLSGVLTKRIRIIVFTMSGFLAALSALIHATLLNQGSHIDGSGYELNAIAAVVIGGTSLAGGEGTILGTVAGAALLSILDNILGLKNIASEYQAILKGVIIILAVVLQRNRSGKETK